MAPPTRPPEEPSQADAEWLRTNEHLIALAENVIGDRLANRKDFGEHTNMALCNEVLDVMMKGLNLTKASASLDGSETSSVLLLGPPGSGKTHVVEWCLRQLQEVQQKLVVLRAHGGAYTSDVECIRHLVAQVADQLVAPPNATASFEQGMEWIRSVLKESFQHASAVVIVLDKFEHFCSRARQTLLYNLFDIAQEVGVRLSIVGMSDKTDVIGMLEKRIKSRFSMRHLHSVLPSNMEELVKVLMAKLKLPDDCGLKPAFRKEFHRKLEAALKAKKTQWRPHVELGRSPSWFLHQCLPLMPLLRGASAAEGQRQKLARELSDAKTPAPPAKRRALEPRASMTEQQVKKTQLESLCEVEHIVLLALYRMRNRQVANRTLSLVLHEIQMLHEEADIPQRSFSQDRYSAAFDRLVESKLVQIGGSGDLSRRYLPCDSCVDQMYARMVQELGRPAPAPCWNLLRSLPVQVQQWALHQRKV